jgi:predicted component of type VI protein secretion system
MNVLMSDQEQEKHQLAGFDARERGFSRPVMFEQIDGGYRAILQYETTRVATVGQATPGAALEELIRMLQGQGYSQLRTQLSVRQGTYLGSQEPWIEYPDPARQSETSDGLIGKFFAWFRRSTIS